MNQNRRSYRLRVRTIPVALGLFILTTGFATAGVPDTSTAAPGLITVERVEGVAGHHLPPTVAPGTRALSLTSADFDEDGIADLAVGTELDGRGLLTVYRGNRHVIYPHSNAPRLGDAPFLTAMGTITTSAPPEVAASGDFDGDGHRDVVIADRGSIALEVFLGRGDGSFAGPTTMALGGSLTALTAGEIHRRDGVTDLVAAIDGEGGPALIILHHSRGALHAAGFRMALPAAADQLVLGSFDDNPALDLAVLAGGGLWLLHGSNRGEHGVLEPVRQTGSMISVADAGTQGLGGSRLAVLSSEGELLLLSREADRSAAKIGVSGWRTTTIARLGAPDTKAVSADWGLKSCRLSAAPTPDILVHDRRSGELRLVVTSIPEDAPRPNQVPPAPGSKTIAELAAVAVSDRRQVNHDATGATTESLVLELDALASAVHLMRLSPDALDDLVLLTPAGGVPRILKSVARADFVVDSTGDDDDIAIGDGLCATASGSCTLRAAITEANSATDLDSISFDIPNATDPGCDSITGVCTILVGAAGLPIVFRPAVLDATTQPGFVDTPLIQLDGSQTGANVTGLAISGGDSTVRGFVINGFANNSDIAAWFLGNDIIEGNFLGTDPTGTMNVGSLNSMHISGITGVTIGGTAPEARNLISANTGPAFAFNSGAFDNLLQGNTFGLDETGAIGLGNSGNDLLVLASSTGNTIGGTSAGAANTIGANTALDYPTVGIASGSSGNLVQGNFIGVNADGVALYNSGIAVTIVDAPDNTIGGATPGAGNVIAFNGSGIDLRGASSTGNSFIANSIHSNDNLGIDLCAVEDAGTGTCLDLENVTPNDPEDPDVGPNNLQNFPTLDLIDRVAETVSGTLDSIPSSIFDIELFVNNSCDPSGHGEGKTPIGSTQVTTDAGGIGAFSTGLPPSLAGGSFLTATATDAAGSTSEFSACLEVPPAADLRLAKNDQVDPVAPGDTLVYGLDLVNDGPDDASGVVITDTLPMDVVFVVASPECVHSAGTVTCTVGDLAALATGSYTIEVTVGDPPGGQLTNTASVSGVEVDPDPANNTATESTTVDASLIFADGFESGDTTRWSETVVGG